MFLLKPHLLTITNLRKSVGSMRKQTIIHMLLLEHITLGRIIQIQSRESIVDFQNARNFRLNSEALPAIVEAVIMCAMQRIALQGHQQDKIDFGSAPLHNEGNFIAIVDCLQGIICV